MTETEWVTSTDPFFMLTFLETRGPVSRRKLRLASCGFTAFWPPLYFASWYSSNRQNAPPTFRLPRRSLNDAPACAAVPPVFFDLCHNVICFDGEVRVDRPKLLLDIARIPSNLSECSDGPLGDLRHAGKRWRQAGLSDAL